MLTSTVVLSICLPGANAQGSACGEATFSRDQARAVDPTHTLDHQSRVISRPASEPLTCGDDLE